MTNCLIEYYRCPSRYAQFDVAGHLSDASGYFRVGDNPVYGKCSGPLTFDLAEGPLWNADEAVRCENGITYLPFDLNQVVDCLRSAELEVLNRRLCGALASAGATIDAIYYCPQEMQSPCSCRKPKPDMLF